MVAIGLNINRPLRFPHRSTFWASTLTKTDSRKTILVIFVTIVFIYSIKSALLSHFFLNMKHVKAEQRLQIFNRYLYPVSTLKFNILSSTL